MYDNTVFPNFLMDIFVMFKHRDSIIRSWQVNTPSIRDSGDIHLYRDQWVYVSPNRPNSLRLGFQGYDKTT